jgi:hypothetical protein
MSAQLHDIESESLPAHVSICQERYKQLDSRIGSVERHLIAIDITLSEIRDAINHDHKAQLKQFLTWASVIITGLLGSCGWLLTHYVLR